MEHEIHMKVKRLVSEVLDTALVYVAIASVTPDPSIELRRLEHLLEGLRDFLEGRISEDEVGGLSSWSLAP